MNFHLLSNTFPEKSNDEQARNFEAVGMWGYLVGETRLREPVQTLQLD